MRDIQAWFITNKVNPNRVNPRKEYPDSQNIDLSRSLQEFWIDSVQQEIPDQNKANIFWSPERSLINREKCKHLAYEQKLFIYRLHQYEWKEITHFWQTFGVCIFTVKRIVRQFSSNAWRKEIFKGIRWRKLICFPAIIDWISEFVKTKTGSFTS